MSKKRFVALLLALMLIFTGIPVTSMAANAASGTDGNIQWSLSTTGTLTISGSGEMPDYSSSKLPPWDSKKSSITSVVINSGVTTVGVYAFKDCSSLKTVNLPSTVTAIRGASFSDCTSLRSVTIPGKVERIYSNAFIGCTGLKTLTISDGVKIINESAFQDCTSLETVYIPDSVTTLYPLSFWGCTNISKFVIKGTPEIPMSSVGWDSVLHGNEMIKTAGPIGGGYDFEYAYTGSIPTRFFSFMYGLESITFPEGVSGNLSAFDYCTSLGVLDIPEGITSASCINCTALEKLVLPKSITSVPRVATCTSLKTIYYRGSEADWQNITKYDLTDSIEIVFNVTDCDIYGHADGTTKIENEVKVTCTEEGSYDSVVYCTACGIELSRENITVSATGHTKGTAKRENVVDPTCTEEGSYDSVVYCTVCGIELSRENITVSATGHTKGTAKRENVADSTCTEEGSYDSVIYCTVCDVEISREPKVIPASHTEGTAKRENEVDATCTEKGSYDSVVYCSECGVELSREKEILPVLGHKESTYIANKIEPDCVNKGSYDIVYHCTVCGVDYRTINQTVPALGHKGSNPVIENEIAPTCVAEGSYDTVVYCSVCHGEVSRETKPIDKEKHVFINYTNDYDLWKQVAYCDSCGAKEEKSIVPDKIGTCGSDLTWEYVEDGVLRIMGSGSMYDYSLTDPAPWTNLYIKKVYLSEGMTSIGAYAFAGCRDITQITIPDSVNQIVSKAFSNSGLEELFIPEGVADIGSGIVSGCANLKSLEVVPGNRYFASDNNNLYSNDKSTLYYYHCQTPGTAIILNTVESFMPDTFNKNVTAFSVEEGSQNYISQDGFIYSVDGATLYLCPPGKQGVVTIPEGVTYVDAGAFAYCDEVTEINFPRTVISMNRDIIIDKDVILRSYYGTEVKAFADTYGYTYESLGCLVHEFETKWTVDKEPTKYADGEKSLHCTKCGYTKTSVINSEFGLLKYYLQSGHEVKYEASSGTTTIIYAVTYSESEDTFTFKSLRRINNVLYECNMKIEAYNLDEVNVSYLQSNSPYYSGKATIKASEYTEDAELKWNVPGFVPNNMIQDVQDVCNIAYSASMKEWKDMLYATFLREINLGSLGFTTYQEPAEHEVVTSTAKAATCEETGLTEGKYCLMCSKIFVPQEVIPATGHSWNEKYTIDKAPTCTEEGSESIHCSKCKRTKEAQVIPVAGHSWNEKYTVDKAPTCTEEGLESIHCSKCKVTKDNKTIGATGHDTKILDAVAATTTKDGLTEGSCCDACGEILEAQNKIAKVSKISLSYTKKNYTGSYMVPTLTVKDSAGKTLVKNKDYKVSGLVKKKSVGRYKVVVSFVGNYSGTKTLYFTIVPKAPTTATANLSVASNGYDNIKFSWSKSTGASGYKVFYKKSTKSSYTWLKNTTGTSVTTDNLAAGVKYDFKVVPYYTSSGTKYTSLSYKKASVYTLKKVSTPTVTKSGASVKVKWKNISGESGYQISKSTSKKGTSIASTYVTTSGSYKLIKATKGKTYYYKVRAYKNVKVGNKTYKVCGPWSEVKAYKRK